MSLMMMNLKIKLVFLFVLATVPLLAQGEFINKSTAIPPLNSGMSNDNANSIFTPNIFTPAKKTSSGGTIEDKQIEFTQNSDFINPGMRVTEKLNKKEGGQDSKMFRKNQYLGDFRSNATGVKISYRDFGDVDGDEIKVLLNDHVVTSKIYLTENYRVLEIGLLPGFNKIDFEALNQGLYGPNTAQFQVYDDKGQLISANQWNLATGFKATIIIFKE